MKLTVRVRNSLYDKRHFYAYPIREVNTYTGDVVPRPNWVEDTAFCLSTGERGFKFRVIEKDSVIDGLLYD